ncbi:MAG TPA: TIGR04255 family protein [Terriglobales bacterium]|nr:TIGR04255 family protein [Terriglobales bacterium]
MRHRYRKPPIAEAVCEFQFVGTREWDWTIPGLVYQEIKSEFPEKKQEKAFEINITPQEGRIQQNLAGTLSKMRFLSRDGSAMVQVGPDLLAVNVSAPYPGWEVFEELLRRQFEIYKNIAEPGGFKRIGLRYVNKIQFPSNAIESTKYFNYYIHLPETLEQRHGPFSMRVLHEFDEQRDILNLQMGHLPPTGDSLTIALDLDYYLGKPESIGLSDALPWVATAHSRIEDMFEASITDETRKLFEVIE